MSDEAEHYPTPHLLEKMKARDVKWAEIMEVIQHPEVVYGPDTQGRRNFQKGDLCVVVSRHKAVITVLIRNLEQWSDEDARNRPHS